VSFDPLSPEPDDMSPSQPADDPGRDYLHRVVDRIETARKGLGMSFQAFADGVGMHKNTYASKVYGEFNSFKINEVWGIAQYVRERTGEAMPGWPWLDKDQADLLELALRLRGHQK
jgi:hypothetical protein